MTTWGTPVMKGGSHRGSHRGEAPLGREWKMLGPAGEDSEQEQTLLWLSRAGFLRPWPPQKLEIISGVGME